MSAHASSKVGAVDDPGDEVTAPVAKGAPAWGPGRVGVGILLLVAARGAWLGFGVGIHGACVGSDCCTLPGVGLGPAPLDRWLDVVDECVMVYLVALFADGYLLGSRVRW